MVLPLLQRFYSIASIWPPVVQSYRGQIIFFCPLRGSPILVYRTNAQWGLEINFTATS